MKYFKQKGQGDFEIFYFKLLKFVVCDFLWDKSILSFCLKSAIVGKEVSFPESFFLPTFPALIFSCHIEEVE